MENVIKDILIENNIEIPDKIERCSIAFIVYARLYTE